METRLLNFTTVSIVIYCWRYCMIGRYTLWHPYTK